MNIDVLTRLPHSLMGFDVFLDGVDFWGVVESGELPDFEEEVEKFMAGTGVAPVSVPVAMKEMSTKVKIAEPSPDIYKRFGQRSQLVFRGSLFASGGDEIPMVVTQTGLLQKISGVKAEAGKRSGGIEFNHDADTITLEINGEELIYIDNINCIKRIGGVNLTASRLSNLGR
ncbi:MAG: hypothetical protein BWK73_04665 [Thiothrix lacustris]|uniref:Phage tail protein n=1 Tax=Thiothrix lacustris TaxID=525917 RepID=A0A1Y1QXH8_9GAMM|nr:MAG: hypothetical protein BWK73_04665 [Thiothrix lacustris]